MRAPTLNTADQQVKQPIYVALSYNLVYMNIQVS